MKTLLADLRASVALTAVFALLLCGAYPLAVWAGGRALFPAQAGGSLLTDADGAVRGSALIGQAFSSERYFQPRPSAAGAGYDASSSSGANLGPTSQKLADSIAAAVAAYRAANHLAPGAPVPADAVTASASGLDPHISLANARLQAARVARARSLPADRLDAVLAARAEDRDWSVFGEPRVNVLLLNRDLDALR